MANRRGKVFVVVLLVIAGSLLGGGLLGFRAWLAHRPHRGGVRAVAISPDGLLVATASDDHSVKLWESADLSREPALRARATFFGHRKGVRSVAFSRDGKTLASEDDDGVWIAWDVDSGARVPADEASRAAATVSSMLLADPAAFKSLVVSPEAGRATCAALSPDRRWLAIGCARSSDASAHVLESGTVVRMDRP